MFFNGVILILVLLSSEPVFVVMVCGFVGLFVLMVPFCLKSAMFLLLKCCSLSVSFNCVLLLLM